MHVHINSKELLRLAYQVGVVQAEAAQQPWAATVLSDLLPPLVVRAHAIEQLVQPTRRSESSGLPLTPATVDRQACANVSVQGVHNDQASHTLLGQSSCRTGSAGEHALTMPSQAVPTNDGIGSGFADARQCPHLPQASPARVLCGAELATGACQQPAIATMFQNALSNTALLQHE